MPVSFATRIFFDIKAYEMEKENLNKEGIYLNYSMDNITEMTLMIIGPKDTPYQDGFYLFDITIPTNYPLCPPEVRFMTQGDKVRFHPNFYIEGYVCLSMLNTWGENEWAPALNIVSVAKTIQSVMNDNPIINEPDYENETGIISQNYIKIIRYHNFKVAMCDFLEEKPLRFHHFLPAAQKIFLDNYDSNLARIDKFLSDDQDTIVNCQTYSMSIKINYVTLKKRFKKLKENIEKSIKKSSKKTPSE